MRALLLLCALPISGAPLKTFIGAAACRPCHPSQFVSQSASGHARSLYRARSHPLAGKFSTDEPLRRGADFRFQFEKLRVRADDGKYVTELPLEWAFGAGAHAVTFVSKVSADYYLEHSFSYYPAAGSFALTPRHDALPSGTLNQAMGQPIKTSAVADCFGCHSTGPVKISAGGDVQISEAGIHCEVCHGPGSAHRASASGMFIENPGKLSPEELNNFCGRCHRVIGSGFDWSSAWSVRHQPPYLARSLCFVESGKLSCLTCHNPHEPVRRNDAAYYSARCATCHQTGDHQRNSDCTSCHMPAIAFDSKLKFANHWIGIYKPGALQPAH